METTEPFQWNFHGIDRAGNALEKDTELDKITALAFSDFSASPSETFGYLADTRTPKLTSINIVADKPRMPLIITMRAFTCLNPVII